jgi:hypothetical protein
MLFKLKVDARLAKLLPQLSDTAAAHPPGT